MVAIAVVSASCSSQPAHPEEVITEQPSTTQVDSKINEDAVTKKPSTTPPILIKTDAYEGVILPDTSMSEWTPSKENIEQFENGFRDYLVSQLKDAGELDETSNNEAKRITYVLDHFNEYKRQYVGIIESGKKVVYCNLIRGSAGDWKNELVVMFDGGPNYFSIHFNVQKERYFDLMINGYA